jgi:hypothetical protein
VDDHAEHEPTDEALARLEDVLLTLPFDRAVPELRVLLDRAAADEDLVLRDERALKLLHEALLARPFGTLDAVQQVNTEVELLTLEVELLADRLSDPGVSAAEAGRMSDRLDEVRDRLQRLREQL